MNTFYTEEDYMAKATKKATKKVAKVAKTTTKKAATKKAAPKATTAKAAAAPKKKRKAPASFKTLLNPGEAIHAVVGDKPLMRSEAISKFWKYVNANGLKDPKDGRIIRPDAAFKKFMGDKPKMFTAIMGPFMKHLINPDKK
jgi:upstream activation factor subunit UAF30